MSDNNTKATTAIAATIDDIWDDSLLIKAYDNSVKLSREELARRIASSTSKLTSEGIHHNHIVSAEMAAAVQSNNSTENPTEYKVGDYCRATYNEDGIDYEAKIISINQNGGTCLLKFIGYENEQEVKLSSLVESWGKKARRLQFAKAKVDEQMTDAQNLPKVSSMENDAKKRNKFLESNINIPPPPPLPPMLSAVNNGEDSEHLSAMLMSWYMSGYYTGVYHGMQMAKCPKESKK